MKKEDLQDGMALLKQPVLPLVSMVQFMYQLSGPGAKVEDIIAEMTGPIETPYTVYPEPDKLLRRYLDQLQLLETVGTDNQPEELNAEVVDASGQPVDAVSACTVLINQRILEAELEEINSCLCAPCHCRLCCVGPEKAMAQEFFEIPLQDAETKLFSLPRHDTSESRSTSALDTASDDAVLQIEGRPFYQGADQCGNPELVHWRNGWSMILPKDASCPALEQNGRCTVYSQRPLVCRRPQIFSYILEALEPLKQSRKYMVRNSLLAVIDCPYVQFLQEEIVAYAAACELECILKANKG
ncbi:MAG: YkgJ family cysteine cluster protein [Candidatus Electrothrix sp. GW3-4]|uniref:YkgJ family cysteine cluster protein n=1 Tax=Candidatus Electrothrix sp. GW3-4 TaxID=3126740 RepID=UPI0030CBC1CD